MEGAKSGRRLLPSPLSCLAPKKLLLPLGFSALYFPLPRCLFSCCVNGDFIQVLGREAPPMKRQDVSNETLKLKTDYEDGISNSSEGGNQSTLNKEVNSIYQEHRVQPCHLSSSIYYGGQDVYTHPQTTKSPGLNSVLKKDGGEDDSGSASRGNWWQGSLYY